MKEIEVQLDFSDITLSETDGIFEDVKKIMLEEPPYNDKWCIRSNLTITSPSGMGDMVIQCHGDGGIFILDYRASIRDVYYNHDIQSISLWAQQNGWKIPQPHFELVKSNKSFWKHFWETLVIDSDYLDKIYGEREQLKEK